MEYGTYMPLTRTYLVRTYQCWVGSHGKQPVGLRLIMVKALAQVPTQSNEDETMTASGTFFTEIPSALWSRNQLPFLPNMLQWNIIVGDGDKVCEPDMVADARNDSGRPPHCQRDR